jgi:hypothetical protein
MHRVVRGKAVLPSGLAGSERLPGPTMRRGCVAVRLDSVACPQWGVYDETGTRAIGDTTQLARTYRFPAYDAADLEVAVYRGRPLACLDRERKPAMPAPGGRVVLPILNISVSDQTFGISLPLGCGGAASPCSRVFEPQAVQAGGFCQPSPRTRVKAIMEEKLYQAQTVSFP